MSCPKGCKIFPQYDTTGHVFRGFLWTLKMRYKIPTVPHFPQMRAKKFSLFLAEHVWVSSYPLFQHLLYLDDTIRRGRWCERLVKWIQTYLDVLSKEERKFLRTHLRENEEPWGFLYLLFKVHKNPLKTRPVVL